jgi:hypothetical protein
MFLNRSERGFTFATASGPTRVAAAPFAKVAATTEPCPPAIAIPAVFPSVGALGVATEESTTELIPKNIVIALVYSRVIRPSVAKGAPTTEQIPQDIAILRPKPRVPPVSVAKVALATRVWRDIAGRRPRPRRFQALTRRLVCLPRPLESLARLAENAIWRRLAMRSLRNAD